MYAFRVTTSFFCCNIYQDTRIIYTYIYLSATDFVLFLLIKSISTPSRCLYNNIIKLLKQNHHQVTANILYYNDVQEAHGFLSKYTCIYRYLYIVMETIQRRAIMDVTYIIAIAGLGATTRRVHLLKLFRISKTKSFISCITIGGKLFILRCLWK